MGEGTPASQTTESLVKRLAGPSTGKAGLAKDQTEINRIIAEASKGSKFYENEKRKDQELTSKINALIKTRDDILRNADIPKVQQNVDLLLAKLESQRDLSQVIVHVDMDAFFANVELLSNPSLAGKPFGVGHGVLSTASYEARKYGVRSGMATYIARKLCPELIVVSISPSRYNEMSAKAFAVFRTYDPNLCAAGCDEGYLNITRYCEDHKITPAACVAEMRQKVFETTALTASAGIAPNLMLAKICSDKNKPNGQFELAFDPDSIVEFMHDLPIRKIPGIGRVTERLLDSIGIQTCGDIYQHRATLSLLDKQFGLEHFLRKYLGIGSNVVAPYQREERKSIGAERTFHSLSDKDQMLVKLEEIATELAREMQKGGWAAMTITLKYKLDTYQVFTRAKSLDRWITNKEDIYSIGKELLLKELPMSIRLVGLRATKLKDLHEDSSKPGIKRFFNGPSPSPRKRNRISLDEDSDNDGHDEVPNDDSRRDIHIGASPGPSTARTIQHDSTDAGSNLEPDVNPDAMICPICFKSLDTDNDGFNAHIDWCLSKGVIQDAQVKAVAAVSSDTKKKPKSNTERKKPHSKSKGSKPKSSGGGAGSVITPWTLSSRGAGGPR